MNPRDYDLEAYWMPFTANRQFKAAPRIFVSAQDMHYTAKDGRKVLDGTAGLWCVNAGHCRPKIVEAIRRQAEPDYSPLFQMGHPGEFRAALIAQPRPPASTAFFCNSGLSP
jgi:beta-alanine--pyruvate transaminase